MLARACTSMSSGACAPIDVVIEEQQLVLFALLIRLVGGRLRGARSGLKVSGIFTGASTCIRRRCQSHRGRRDGGARGGAHIRGREWREHQRAARRAAAGERHERRNVVRLHILALFLFPGEVLCRAVLPRPSAQHLLWSHERRFSRCTVGKSPEIAGTRSSTPAGDQRGGPPCNHDPMVQGKLLRAASACVLVLCLAQQRRHRRRMNSQGSRLHGSASPLGSAACLRP